ncbi:hypothetical protein J5N97_002924 [Dioscorea zingiberensis]|uniref:Homeobox-leucine zipper protein n=1 Tax=Dioscorea zingiberensis TaxID=325984 RepID=A0A9D5D3R2_9LILI|nr:hypothetical protein J5N97_002924 [Dioscorea zingiberensis]
MCSAGAHQGGEKKRRLSTDQVRALEKSFENRRARWKTKQLERDFTALRSSYDVLKLDYEALHQHKESLLAEIKELKSKLAGEESFSSVKEEPSASDSETKATASDEDPHPTLIYKDGFSDSDSSAVINEDNNSPYRGFSLLHPSPPPPSGAAVRLAALRALIPAPTDEDGGAGLRGAMQQLLPRRASAHAQLVLLRMELRFKTLRCDLSRGVIIILG